MSLASSTGRLPRGYGSRDVLSTARALDLRSVYVSMPVPRAAAWRRELKAGGVAVCGVGHESGTGASDEDPARLEGALTAAIACASALKASAVVVEGGGLTGEREVARESAADRAVRALHAGLRSGVPMAVRPGGGPDDLLGLEETGWILSELPALGLWLDPARAVRAQRLECGPALDVWVDAYAGRCGGLFVQGLTADLRTGVHPAEGDIDWRGLAEALPRGVPWVLDLASDVADDAMADAVAMLRQVLK